MKAVICVALKSELPEYVHAPVLYTGVGKVNATYALTEYLFHHKVDTVINMGSAGGLHAKDRYTLQEIGRILDGDMHYPNYVENWIDVVNPDLYTLGTFDSFQTTKPSKKMDCVDMEAYALAYVCQKLGKRFICYKYISDIIGDDNQEQKWIKKHSSGQALITEQLNKILLTSQ
mgnify:CR=1 FL=1